MSAFGDVLSWGSTMFGAATKFLPGPDIWLDQGAKAASDAGGTAGAAAKSAGSIPLIGTVINGLQAGYHAASAGYDALTGDRDGAVNHGTQAAFDLAAMIPGMGGLSAAAVPAAEAAVLQTNTLLGKDDTNWFAGGSTPQGTRRGEIGAGVSGMLSLPLALLNDKAGNPVGNLLGDLFGVDAAEGTSGAKPGSAATLGQDLHEGAGKGLGRIGRAVSDVFDWLSD